MSFCKWHLLRKRPPRPLTPRVQGRTQSFASVPKDPKIQKKKRADLSIQMQAFKWVGNFNTKTNPKDDGGCTWRSAVSCLLVSVLLNGTLSVTWELRLAHATDNHDQSWIEWSWAILNLCLYRFEKAGLSRNTFDAALVRLNFRLPIALRPRLVVPKAASLHLIHLGLLHQRIQIHLSC